jgi:outer membrane protein assembly factor BamB
VAWGGRIFLTVGDKDARAVVCVDADSGEILWTFQVGEQGSKGLPKVTEDTGYAAPTPVTDGRVVAALFATGDLVCLDVKGAEVWKRKLGIPENPYGHGSSLMIRGDRLLVQYDHSREAKVMALDLLTGKTFWSTDRDVAVSWCTPIVIGLEGKLNVVLNGNPVAASYDFDTGGLLWETECMMGEIASSPAYDRGVVFVANENACLVAMDPSSGRVLWDGDFELPDVSSPVAFGGRLFVASPSGVVTCYEGATGKELWSEEFGRGFWASPVVAGGFVFAMDQKGVMRIFKAAASFSSVGNPELGEPSLCTPAFVGRRIYIRGERRLFCIEKKDG